uniref:Integral membrane protein 2 n=1 Tax=Caligus rogercresseyi TaxID=217165 RepID=C1BPV5_CALRO|nr:Integral membrane protein 2B [Caligus rogercresseyi]
MTVLTKGNTFLSEKKSTDPAHSEKASDSTEKQKLNEEPPKYKILDDAYTSVPINDGFDNTDFRQGTVISQTFLLLIGIVAMTVGFMGATHLYKQLEYQSSFRGVCRIPYQKLLDTSSAMVTGDFKNHENHDKVYSSMNPWVQRSSVAEKIMVGDSVELDYELDIENNAYESLEIPEISRGRYLHDFKMNKTAIIDPKASRCFVMPLNREEIEPPRSLVDIIKKMRDGTYKLDFRKIRKDTRVVLPALTDLTDYGFFIEKSCYDKKTYRLEEATGTRFIRSAEEKHEIFVEPFIELAGKTVLTYNIINLNDI